MPCRIPPALLGAALLFGSPLAFAEAGPPGGPRDVEPKVPPSTGKDVYTPREANDYAVLRVGTAARLSLNPIESTLAAHEQMQRYLMELGAGGDAHDDAAARARAPERPRLLMVDLGLSRTALIDTPVLPSPKQSGDLYPGAGYSPARYPETLLGPINAVRAAVTLSPKGTAGGLMPVFAGDVRVPTRSNQGAAEMLLRAGATKAFPTASGALRLGIWAGFANEVIGLREPVPSATAGLFLLAPEGGIALTRAAAEVRLAGSGDFFDTVTTLEAEQAVALARGRLLASAGGRLTLRSVDEVQYLSWTGFETLPYTLGYDVDALARLSWVGWEKLRVHAAGRQTVAHTDDAFIDGFYRATGPEVGLGVSGLLFNLLEIDAGYSIRRWDGASVRPDDWEAELPPEEIWWSSMLTIGAQGRF